MIRKAFHNEVGYSVVELDGARAVFAAASPRRGNTLQEQTEDVLQKLKSLFDEEGVSGAIVMQSVFLDDIENQNVCRRIMRDFYGKQLPATTYIPQPPCDGKTISVEAWGLGRGKDEVEIERVNERLVIARHNGIHWAYLADVRPERAEGSVYDRAGSFFRSANQRLNAAGMCFEDVIRTWLYLGDITGNEGESLRYRELNRARTDFYRNLKFGNGLVPPGWERPFFPASTGIGVLGDDLILGGLALRTSRRDLTLVPLENPRQTSAYDYAHQYGSESPKFARAMAVVADQWVATFISGTASITASETRHLGDIEHQTRQTLDNIEALIAAENFQNHGLSGRGAILDDLALARVYIKRREDYAAARAVCRARLGDLPILYVVADICRPELLVEIEGIAFSR